MRIVLSYIPFKRYLPPEHADIQKRISNLNIGFSSAVEQVTSPKYSNKEGLYDQEEGKNMEYKDRVLEQDEIKNFIAKVFAGRNEISFEQYLDINTRVSSEMFCSIMCMLHERLPCAQNIFRLKKIFRTK